MSEISKPLGEVVDAGSWWRRYRCECCDHTWEPKLSDSQWVQLERKEDSTGTFVKMHCPECQAADAAPESDTRATFTDGPLLRRMRGAS